MPSMTLSKLRSAGTAVLSSLPQGSTGFGKVVGYGGSQSRSTSAGSSLSEGQSLQEHSRSRGSSTTLSFPLQEESLFATDMFGPLKQESSILEKLSRPLTLEEYHEERQSIRTLKEFYEDYKPIESIGLPPGLFDEPETAEPAQPEFFHAAFDFTAPQFWQGHGLDAGAGSFAFAGDLLDNGDQQGDASVGEFGSSEKACGVVGRPLNANAQPFNVSAKPLNADAKEFNMGGNGLSVDGFDTQPFSISGKPLNADATPFNVVGKTLNANAQPFDMGVQSHKAEGKTLNVDAMPFDMGVPSFDISGQMSNGMEAFDSGIGSFLVEDHSLDANAQVFNNELEWFHSQAAWDTPVLSTDAPVLSTDAPVLSTDAPIMSWIA